MQEVRWDLDISNLARVEIEMRARGSICGETHAFGQCIAGQLLVESVVVEPLDTFRNCVDTCRIWAEQEARSFMTNHFAQPRDIGPDYWQAPRHCLRGHQPEALVPRCTQK